MPPAKGERKIRRLTDSLRSSSFRVEVKGYCENSSIHGIKYVIEKQRPYFERFLWLVILIWAIILAGYYTGQVWNETPIVNMQSINIYENPKVPLPAVTVCSNAKVSKSSNWGQTTTSNKDLHTLRFLCGEAFPNSRGISIKRLNETAPAFENTCTLDIETRNGTLDQQNCKGMFQKVISEQGVCWTFNSFHPKNVYRHDVYLGEMLASSFGFYDSHFGEYDGEQRTCGNWDIEAQEMLLSKEPHPEDLVKHLKCGNHTLKISMYSTRDDKGYCTFRNETGFKVIIHNPKDAPSAGLRRLIWTKEEDSEFHSIDIKTEEKITVKAEAKITSYTDDLLWFNPAKRQCYADQERNLRYFQIYTRYNCLLECLTNMTLDLCGCVDFYMPHIKGMEVCKRVNLPCIFDTIDLFKKKKQYCDCYPPCYNLIYEIQTRTIYDSGSSDTNWNDSSLTLRLDLNVTEEVRTPAFSDVKVISGCGGVYGIFCGMSILSLVEILYFAMVRACGNYYKDFKQKYF